MGWKIEEHQISKNETVVLIDIESIDGELKKLIDEYIVKICEGKSSRSVSIVKLRLSKFFDGKMKTGAKKSIETVKGAIAEFFIHLYLNSKGFRQECFFLNMEEHSIKKGFDGFYSNEDKEWIMESKSGDASVDGNKHYKKIDIAYKDLVGKFNGESDNDPWQEAYSHAGHRDINADKSILDALRNLSDDFWLQKPHKSAEFCIIPCGTIYIEDSKILFNSQTIKTEVTNKIKDYSCKSIVAIAITQKSINMFLDYIKK